MTTLPEGKLDTLLTRHSVVEAELSRQLPPEQFVKLCAFCLRGNYGRCIVHADNSAHFFAADKSSFRS